jgi:hypothetical protein
VAKKNKKESKKQAKEPTAAAKWEKVEERCRVHGIVLMGGLCNAMRHHGDNRLVMVYCDTTNGLVYLSRSHPHEVERCQVDEATREVIEAHGGDYDGECTLYPPEPGVRGVLDDWIEEPDFFH